VRQTLVQKKGIISNSVISFHEKEINSQFQSIDELDRYLENLYNIQKIIPSDNNQYFNNLLKEYLKLINRDKGDDLGKLTDSIYEIVQEIEKKDLNQELILHDTVEKISYIFDGVDDFSKGALQIMRDMKKHDFRFKDKSQAMRCFFIPYYDIFQGISKMDNLITDIDSARLVLEKISEFVKESLLHRKYRGWKSERAYYRGGGPLRRINSLMDIFKDYGSSFRTFEGLDTFLEKLSVLEKKIDIDANDFNLSGLFPYESSRNENEKQKRFLDTEDKLIRFVDVLDKYVIGYDKKNGETARSLIRGTFSKYGQLAQNPEDLESLAEFLFKLDEKFESGYRTYDSLVPIFLDMVPSIPYLIEHENEFFECIKETKELPFSTYWGDHEYKKKLGPILSSSVDFKDYLSNLRSLVSHINKTSEIMELSSFFNGVMPLLSKEKSLFSLRNKISFVQKYIRKWNDDGLEPGSVFYNSINPFRDERGVKKIVKDLDEIIEFSLKEIPEKMSHDENLIFDIPQTKYHSYHRNNSFDDVKRPRVIVEALDFMKNKMDITPRLLSEKTNLELYQFALDVVKASFKTGLDYELFRVDHNYGVIDSLAFHNNYETCRELLVQGLIPTKELLDIYSQRNKQRREELVKEIFARIDTISNNGNKFDASNYLDVYATFLVIAHDRGDRHVDYKNFLNQSEMFAKGKDDNRWFEYDDPIHFIREHAIKK
jgi:hypothetical protein